MNEIKTLTGWKARRAGGRITINGVCDGKPLRVVGVDEIEADTPHPIATDKDGNRYALA